MKAANYIAQFLAALDIRHVFAMSGGASLHLIHGIDATDDIDFVCVQHEQAGAMAADAYARTTRNLGAAVATSGPGATNLITGICSAYYDSVPVLYLTGQVSRFRFKGDTGVRQIGFQETDIVSMCQPVTKSAVTVTDPSRLRYELEKAVWTAREGRPGPVLLDIPDDLQREDIDPDRLEGFIPPVADDTSAAPPLAVVEQCVQMLQAAQRPVLVVGSGVSRAGADEDIATLIDKLNIPVLLTWGSLTQLSADHPLAAETFGTHGTRTGNFTVQNADLVLSIGARLDTHAAGSPFSSFAREAKKIIVDIDGSELRKFKRFDMPVDLPVEADSKAFITALLDGLDEAALPDVSPWKDRVADWKRRYPAVRPECRTTPHLDPYVFVEALGAVCESDETIVSDTGCALAWMCQGFPFQRGQKFLHAFNNTPMGYALPAALGASLAENGKRVVCVTGDGGLQINIQELATVVRHNLPVKLFLINNHGYSMIQQTQDQWLDGNYLASTIEGGLAFPDWEALASSYGFSVFRIADNAEAPRRLKQAMETEGPVFCNVEFRPEERVIPQVKYGRPIEDGAPLLPRDEFLTNMIVAPDPAFLKD